MTELYRTDYPKNEIDLTPVDTPPIDWVPTLIDVSMWLGYSHSHPDARVQPNNPNVVEVHRLVAWLQYWDIQLKDSTATAMADKVGTLDLNWTQSVALIKAEANRTLHALAALLDVPIYKNRYFRNNQTSTLSIKRVM